MWEGAAIWVALGAFIVAAIGLLVTLAKFWMDMGATKKTAENASAQAVASWSLLQEVKDDMNKMEVEAAKSYATYEAMGAFEKRMGAHVRESVDHLTDEMRSFKEGVRDDLRSLGERVDHFMAFKVHQ